VQEDVDQAGDDDADQAHEQERAETGQIALRGVAVEAHGAEGRRRDEGHAGDRGSGVDQKDGRQREAEQPGVDKKQSSQPLPRC
jgi:hypothetical protein